MAHRPGVAFAVGKSDFLPFSITRKKLRKTQPFRRDNRRGENGKWDGKSNTIYHVHLLVVCLFEFSRTGPHQHSIYLVLLNIMLGNLHQAGHPKATYFGRVTSY